MLWFSFRFLPREGSKTEESQDVEDKMQSFWQRVFKSNSINALVPKKCAPKTCEIDAKCWAIEHPWEKFVRCISQRERTGG